MSHGVREELLLQVVKQIRECIAENMRCNHPQDDGSDDPCSGDDCIHCYVLMLTDSVAEAPETAPSVPTQATPEATPGSRLQEGNGE